MTSVPTPAATAARNAAPLWRPSLACAINDATYLNFHASHFPPFFPAKFSLKYPIFQPPDWRGQPLAARHNKELFIANPAPYFFLSAAEHSGDALGAGLITALGRQFPDARFAGVGGDLMAAAGCQLLANPVKRSAMLAGAIFSQGWYWWKLMRVIRRELAGTGAVALAADAGDALVSVGRKPDVVIPIDSSFINLRIAAAAKSQGIPVCYYVAPQLWASRPGRIKKVQANVDTLCCILPFEEAYFKERHVNALYVGHPMFDIPVTATLDAGGSSASDTTFSRTPGMGPHIAMFPGSRRAEIDAHMPAMIKILREIKGRYPRARFIAVAPSEERAWQMRHHLRVGNTPIDIRVGNPDAVIAWADLVLCKSGTTTLQAARQAKPMVVMFAVPRYQWAFARHLIHTPFFALVNILAGKEIVREFVPFHGSVMPVARACLDLLGSVEKRNEMESELQALVATLQPREGIPASDRVAREVEKLLK